MAEIKITQNNFADEVIGSNIPVLIDFWAAWCGPCRMIAPAVAEIAEQYNGKIKVGKINVDEEQALAMQFGISSIPTLVLIKDGKIAETAVGFRTKEQIEKMLG